MRYKVHKFDVVVKTESGVELVRRVNKLGRDNVETEEDIARHLADHIETHLIQWIEQEDNYSDE